MSFNKRHLNESNLRYVYEQGYTSLYNYIVKPDAIITSDDFSDTIVEALRTDEPELLIKKLMER